MKLTLALLPAVVKIKHNYAVFKYIHIYVVGPQIIVVSGCVRDRDCAYV